MPEKPEVITVAKKLEKQLLGKKIIKAKVYHNNIVEKPSVNDFETKIKGQTIHSITTRGKWIVISLDTDYLLSHLRMEGKFFFRDKGTEKGKHEHVIIELDNDKDFRFADVRKFGKMMLIPKDELLTTKQYKTLGLEPWDKTLNVKYLRDKYKNKRIPIKTTLLDQTIIAGIGNIYADEILFLSRINPLTEPNKLKNKDLDNIIKNTISVLDKAISEGGTTIRSYTSEEGVTGLFQNSLNVHSKKGENCPNCKSIIEKTKVGGRGTYFCPKCQK